MRSEPAYITPNHRYAFRSGEPALILGVVIYTPWGQEPNLEARPCFHVRYSDGVEDHIPLSDYVAYSKDSMEGMEIKAGGE